MKKYNTPHRSRVIKICLTEEESGNVPGKTLHPAHHEAYDCHTYVGSRGTDYGNQKFPRTFLDRKR